MSCFVPLATATQAGPIGAAADAVVAWLLQNGAGVFNGINGLILGLAGVSEMLLMAEEPFVC